MNFTLTVKADPNWIRTRREQNDDFRKTGRGHLSLSAGIVALGSQWQQAIIGAVRRFGDFDFDDPFDCHDIGDFELTVDEPGREECRLLVFFRIETLNPSETGNAAQADRVLSLMLATEW